jgi:hypothetical protein
MLFVPRGSTAARRRLRVTVLDQLPQHAGAAGRFVGRMLQRFISWLLFHTYWFISWLLFHRWFVRWLLFHTYFRWVHVRYILVHVRYILVGIVVVQCSTKMLNQIRALNSNF